MTTLNENIYKERCGKLNDAQRAAVETIEGPLLVVAGPGSGKTEILSLRIANILRSTDVYPAQVLAVTFTDAAAVNMRKRLESIIGVDAYRTSIYTFHSFALSVIDRYPEYFYGGARFAPADEAYQAQVLEDIFSAMSYDNPLRSEHPEMGFVYMGDIKMAVSSLKKAGLTPAEFRSVLMHNEEQLEEIEADIDTVFGERMSKSIFPQVEGLLGKLTKVGEKAQWPATQFEPLAISLERSLRLAYHEAVEEDKTSPLSEWKRDNVRKVQEKYVLKVSEYSEKMHALADVYEAYTIRLRSEGYVDFDDMLLDVIEAVDGNDTLRSELEEQFQYILVDEFQDTNDAQMRLLLLLTSSPVHEGRPNIMAVGDDDQAIYKFQGAEVSNILQFTQVFPAAQVVTMTRNYRSIQGVLDVARHVITQGRERLEALLPDIEKNLVAARSDLEEGNVMALTFDTPEHEYHGIVEECKKCIDEGIGAGEIAVIARRHRDLEALVPYFHEAGVSVVYERSGNVLSDKHIHELIQMARFVGSVARRNKEEADDLLPEILSYPFWKLPREMVWKLSLDAGRSDGEGEKLWIEAMLESEHKKLQDIASFFIRVATDSLHQPLEYVLDDLVGAHVPLIADDADGEDGADEVGDESEFVSPYKDYYFSRERFEENRDEYLRFLTSLKTLVGALREYKTGQVLSIEDMLEFVDIHEKNNLPVTNKHPFSNGVEAVHLMTAHKAKGLEFDTVFVLSALQDVWAPRARGSLLPFPPNLPIAPAGDTLDDQLRLFYVAVTRARHRLYISAHTRSESGKEMLSLEFLSGSDVNNVERDAEDGVTLLESLVPHYHTPPFKGAEKSLLAHLVENYQLSVTHYNNFLDVTHGGPQTFLEQNLLRFPQPKSVSGIFGSAIHATLEYVYKELKNSQELPGIRSIQDFFAREMKRARIADDERTRLIERGEKALFAYFEEKKESFSSDHKIECNFKDQGVVVGGAHLTGKIDKMVLNDKEVVVHDWKTGSPEEKWNNSSTKLWRYKNQLIFYKLLVEHSKDYGRDYKVEKGVLEFVEPTNRGDVVTLPLEIEKEDVERVAALVEKVCAHIQNLDFPSVEDYPESVAGIRAFEEALLDE